MKGKVVIGMVVIIMAVAVAQQGENTITPNLSGNAVEIERGDKDKECYIYCADYCRRSSPSDGLCVDSCVSWCTQQYSQIMTSLSSSAKSFDDHIYGGFGMYH